MIRTIIILVCIVFVLGLSIIDLKSDLAEVSSELETMKQTRPECGK